MERLLRNRWFLVLGLALVLATLPLAFPSNYYFRVAALVNIFALAAIGLNLLMGYAGQVSLGHAGFMGIGAYAVAIGASRFGLHGIVAMLAGAAIAGLLAFLVGRPILRLKGHYLAVATLGLGLLISMVLTNEAGWTGGPDGMAVPRLELFGMRLRGPDTWYMISAGALVLGVILALNLIESPTGRAMRAIHDSEIAARVVGVDVAAYKLKIFVISAIYASIAGSLMAFLNGHITPDGTAGFLRSVELVTMVVLGGLGSILGAIVGAAMLVILPQALTIFHEYEHLLLGLIIMASMILLPRGVIPSLLARLRGGGA
ncbi:MAG: branched-chain amino acid ABC transporter permease [Beijerinckiaceae bacterium]|jgi:branched-chain amino acid transport system permease protein|nr:branched-chain amino acid ABC transporter permease [Beijerinckiaceae bacterium]